MKALLRRGGHRHVVRKPAPSSASAQEGTIDTWIGVGLHLFLKPATQDFLPCNMSPTSNSITSRLLYPRTTSSLLFVQVYQIIYLAPSCSLIIMARNINGSGFKLYFPDAEESTNTPPQVTSSLNHIPATPPITETKQTTVGTDNASKTMKEPSEGETLALKSPSWQPDATTPTQRTSGEAAIDLDKHPPVKHRTSLSISPVEVARLSEPDQEPNIRSYQDSRRRSSQLAEGSWHATSTVPSGH